MERTFHCSYDNLKAICRNGTGWGVKALTAFDAINVKVPQKSGLPSEEDYIRMTRGDTSQPEYTDDLFLYLDSLQRSYNLPRISTCTSMEDIDWEKRYNDVCTRDIFSGNDIPAGIATLNTPDFSYLNKTWDIPTYKDEEFSWGDFFLDSIPPSNSAMLIDRYLFQSFNFCKQGAENVESILWRTIPPKYDGEYGVLIVFDRKQLEGDNTVPLPSAIAGIDQTIRSGLTKKKCRLRIEYLAVWDSDFEMSRVVDSNQHSLYGMTHDRVVYTNCYTISATKALAATKRKGKSEVATYDQTLYYASILKNINLKRFNLDYLPIRSDRKKLERFLGLLDSLAEDKVSCYRTTSEDPAPRAISKTEITNRILNSARA